MFEPAKKQMLNLGLTGLAAIGLVSGTMACAQEAPAPAPKTQTHYITDPAQIEAILAECGLNTKALPKKSAKAPAAPPAAADGSKPEGPAPFKRRCMIRQADHK